MHAALLRARDAAKQTKQPDTVIDAAMIQAVQIAEKIAPYRHPRLTPMKLAGDPNNRATSRTMLLRTSYAPKLCGGLWYCRRLGLSICKLCQCQRVE